LNQEKGTGICLQTSLHGKQSNICSFIFSHPFVQTDMTTEAMTLVHFAL